MKVGIDVLEYNKIKDPDKFLNRIGLENEIKYIKEFKTKQAQIQRIASLWCVKEAVFKCLNLGKNSKVSTKDVELCHESTGKPYVKLFNHALKAFQKLQAKEIEISLSHSDSLAIAICICK